MLDQILEWLCGPSEPQLEVPRNLYYSKVNEALDSLSTTATQKQKKDVVNFCVGIFENFSDGIENLNEPVNMRVMGLHPYQVPLWLYILINCERLYLTSKTLGAREKKLGPLVDAALAIDGLDFRLRKLRSVTLASKFFGCYYLPSRLVSIDPYCGEGDDFTVAKMCNVHGAAGKETEMAIGVLRNVPDIKSKINRSSSDKGYTALHLACAWSNYALVEWLLDNGADPNLQDYGGQTPIWHCLPGSEPNIGTGKPRTLARPIIELLLKKGADPHIENDKGKVFVKHLTKSWRYKEGDFDGLAELIESTPRTENNNVVKPAKYGLAKEISHEQIMEQLPRLMKESDENIVLMLVRLFHYMAIYEFGVSDIVEILRRTKRKINKQLPRNHLNRVRDEFNDTSIFEAISSITFETDSPIEMNRRDKSCRIIPDHSFFETKKRFDDLTN